MSSIPNFMIESKPPGNYIVALQMAQKMIMEKNPDEIAKNADVCYRHSSENAFGTFSFLSLGQQIAVELPECNVVFQDTDKQPILEWRLVMLHYLAHANGIPLSDALAHFRQMPGGNAYQTPFNNRSVGILSRMVDKVSLEALCQACLALGGTIKQASPDVQAEFMLLPRFPMILQIWKSDGDMPPYVNVLFDQVARHYLPTEDMAVAASFLIRFIAKKLSITAA